MLKSNIVNLYKKISNNLSNPQFQLPLTQQETLFAYFYNNLNNLDSLEKSMLEVIITFIINNQKEICPTGKKLVLTHIANKAFTKHMLTPLKLEFDLNNENLGEFIPHTRKLNISSLIFQYDLNGKELTNLIPDSLTKFKNTNNLLVIIFVINYLIEHYNQYNEKQNNQINENALSYTKYSLFSKKTQSKVTFSKFNFLESEYFANLGAINTTLEYLSQYKYNNKTQLEYLYQEWTQINNHYHIFLYTNIPNDISRLLSNIQNNPVILNTDPLLNNFFHKEQLTNITIRPLNELVTEYNQLRALNSNIIAHQKEDVYRNFILYSIIQQDYQINTNEPKLYCRVVFEIIRDFLTSLTLPTNFANQDSILNAITYKLNSIINLINLLKSLDNDNRYLPKCQYFIQEFLKKFENPQVNQLTDSKDLKELINKLKALNIPSIPPKPPLEKKKKL